VSEEKRGGWMRLRDLLNVCDGWRCAEFGASGEMDGVGGRRIENNDWDYSGALLGEMKNGQY